MHKYFIVKAGGKWKKHLKYVKKRMYILRNQRGICKSREEEKFSETGGEINLEIEITKIEGEIRNFWSMNKKRSTEILADEIRKMCTEKGNMQKISTESETFFGNREGKSERRGGMHHCLRGDGRPWVSI